jgi:pimeloyl-ACP methyl ester carboxylesterase
MDAPVLTAKDAIELSDGRALSYSAAGRTRGIPILYFHGAIGSPPTDRELEQAIERLGLRYLMVDRPGFNGSDPQPGRRVADFAADVRQLADRLRLPRFSILGVSAGAPYALACAAAMPGDSLLADTLATLRERGARIAIDDTGAGYAGLKQVMWVRPDIVKLDLDLTRGIHAEPGGR